MAKAGTDIITAHHGNNEAITPTSEECHSFIQQLFLSASFEHGKALWERKSKKLSPTHREYTTFPFRVLRERERNGQLYQGALDFSDTPRQTPLM